jgi:hypothetical protein
MALILLDYFQNCRERLGDISFEFCLLFLKFLLGSHFSLLHGFSFGIVDRFFFG